MTYGNAEVALATIVVAVAASLAGASGYGFSLMAAPLLLLAGLDAGPVVFSCLSLPAVTRLALAIRFRASVERSSAGLLIAGSLRALCWEPICRCREREPAPNCDRIHSHGRGGRFFRGEVSAKRRSGAVAMPGGRLWRRPSGRPRRAQRRWASFWR